MQWYVPRVSGIDNCRLRGFAKHHLDPAFVDIYPYAFAVNLVARVAIVIVILCDVYERVVSSIAAHVTWRILCLTLIGR